MSAVLNSKHYNRAVRTHKYIYEALMRLAWGEFTVWVEANLQESSAMIKAVLDKVSSIACDLKQETLDCLLLNPLLPELMF